MASNWTRMTFFPASRPVYSLSFRFASYSLIYSSTFCRSMGDMRLAGRMRCQMSRAVYWYRPESMTQLVVSVKLL